MKLLNTFDPWKSRLCTCPAKYSFNPYTGCSHNCLYCYATYIPEFWHLREKKDLFRRLEKELEELPSNAIVSMSNSSDPYPPVEKSREITRRCLQLMKEFDVHLLVVTKSDLVVRDLDLLTELKAAVAVTVTGKDAEKLEVNAPSTEKRMHALKSVKDAGIPAILRLDPLLPWTSKQKWMDVIEKCSFVDHVVTSTLKLKRDGYMRIVKSFPELENRISKLYLEEGERVGSYMYLNKERREAMLNEVAEKCRELGISYGFCREGIKFSSKSCDGTHLIPT